MQLTVNIRELRGQKNTHEVLVMNGANHVGRCELRINEGITLVDEFAIFRDFRRRGIAQLLLKLIQIRCGTDLALVVFRDNAAAIACYEKCGFVMEGACDQFLEGVLKYKK